MSLPTCSTEPILTPRERDILQLITQGDDNKVISETLGIARSTVESHVHHILEKLNAANRAQAVASAIRLGLIDADNVE